jgi:hypothetical protein
MTSPEPKPTVSYKDQAAEIFTLGLGPTFVRLPGGKSPVRRKRRRRRKPSRLQPPQGPAPEAIYYPQDSQPVNGDTPGYYIGRPSRPSSNGSRVPRRVRAQRKAKPKGADKRRAKPRKRPKRKVKIRNLVRKDRDVPESRADFDRRFRVMSGGGNN